MSSAGLLVPTTSAGLAAYLTDESGTGAIVLVNTPTLISPVIAATTASAGTAMKHLSGTVMTTPEAGAREYDGNAFYGTPAASNRGVMPCMYFICLSGTNVLTSQTANQPIFDSVGGGVLTLPTGTYFFDMLLYISGMDAGAASNAAIDIKGGGTATVGSILIHAVGQDAALATVGALSGETYAAVGSAASIVTGAAVAAMTVSLRGTFRITGAGTLIPGIALAVAAAATVNVGSYFRCYCVGGTAVQTVGQWS